MCNFWPFRKRKPEIKETAMTIENALNVVRKKLADYKAYVAKLEAAAKVREDAVATEILGIADSIPVPGEFDPSGNG